jgi:hypothetical protein
METILPPKKNSIQDSVGDEENEYLVSTLKKTIINVTEEPSDTQKNKPQRQNL